MVREPFRSVDKNSYTPEYVPIGPYHANRSSPRIEQLKRRSVEYLEDCAGGGLARLVEELQPQARQHYRDGVGVGREELSRVLLHDGCFLLACTVKYDDARAGTSTSESSSSRQSGAEDVCGDTVARDTVFLLENQIPFFVLDRIHQRVTQGARPLIEIMEPYVQKLLHDSMYVSPHAPAPTILQEPPSHLLHLVHSYFVPAPAPSPSPSQLLQPGGGHPLWHQATRIFNRRRRPNDAVHAHTSSPVHSYFEPAPSPSQLLQLGGVHPLWHRRPPNDAHTSSLRTGRWRRATEYCKYGNVRFKCRGFAGDERWTVLDVRLEGGTLWIPRLRVDSMTWTVLRNLMALEEHTSRRPVTAYCVFMSQVASKVEDVECLQRQGILEHFLGSDEEVAQGFADLCKGVVMDVHNLQRNYLKPIWHQLHQRCNYMPNNAIGSFRHKYCGDPMYVAGFVAGAFIFIFQLAQVILALISVLQQRKH
ncbi:hypothetical protein ACQ4PT_008743 [Festuca glaucescens]